MPFDLAHQRGRETEIWEFLSWTGSNQGEGKTAGVEAVLGSDVGSEAKLPGGAV